jgi:Tfp pilus assembly protein PilV
MFLVEEILIEVAMIAAVIVAIACLAYLLQVSVRERVYLRRRERERWQARSAMIQVFAKPSGSGRPDPASDASPLREKRA